MYDVVKTTTINGKQYLLCFNDSKENLILEKLQKVIKATTENSSNSGKHHLSGKSFLPDLLPSFSSDSGNGENIIAPAREYFDYTSALAYCYLKINSPPPNINFKLNKQT